MNINRIDETADMIIRAYSLDSRSTRARIYAAIETFCDDPATTRMTMHRIYCRICDILN